MCIRMHNRQHWWVVGPTWHAPLASTPLTSVLG